MNDHSHLSPIMLVEDSPEDYETILRAMRRAGIDSPAIHCRDGEEALHLLLRQGSGENGTPMRQPAIMLLDLNLPGLDGRDVLLQVKAHPALRSLPILVLSTSANERDVEFCYRMGANAYIRKPLDIAVLMRAMVALKQFWLETAILPKGTLDHE